MPRRQPYIVALTIAFGFFLCAPVLAAVIVYDVTNIPDSYNFTGGPAVKLRDGFIDNADGQWINMGIIGYAPLELASNQKARMAYGGGWPIATDIPFTFTYVKARGVISLQVILAPDDRPYISRRYNEFRNYDFLGIRVNLGGAADEVVTVKNITVNGTNLGSFSSARDIYYYLTNSNFAPFADLTITGLLNFSNLGVNGSPEFARFEIALSSQPIHTPIPASALLMGSGLLGLGLLGWRRKKPERPAAGSLPMKDSGPR